MASTPKAADLDGHQRHTLLQIYEHPTSHNVEWHRVLTLLDGVGSVEQRHDGKYEVRIGNRKVVLTGPKHKDIAIDEVLELRRMLTDAGWSAVAEELVAKGEEA